MMYRDRVFRNAMVVEIAMEVIACILDKPVLLDVAVVALVTTTILWQIFFGRRQEAGWSQVQMMMKRLLAVMDGEGRKLEAVIFEGERIYLIDSQGKWREGLLKRVMADGITVVADDGHLRCYMFHDIDFIEKEER